jgi:Flp pilus assembly protein TadG
MMKDMTVNVASTPQRGQSIVEFALLAPLLIVLLIGMVDFSLAFVTNIRIHNAVADGAYFAAQNPGNMLGVQKLIEQELRSLSGFNPASDVTVQCDMTTKRTTVTVRYDYRLLFGLVGPGQSVRLSSSNQVPQFGVCL